MPGNEVGDRVHNFFAPENLSQGQHHTQVGDGNWPVLGNNLWVTSQRHIGGQGPNPKNFNLQQSDPERGHGSHSLEVPHGLNFTQSTPRPDLANSQFQSPLPNLNGYIHGHQVFQTRQNEANFLGVDTESDQRNIMSRGLSTFESQQGNGPEHHMKIPLRSETSESPVSFDFFGSQQQMSAQQPNMLQSLPQQQPGFNDMQLLQQEVMFRKFQELQRLQQLQQVEARQQTSMNQISSFAKQGSGNHSPTLINSTPVTEASSYPWATELTTGNANWLQRASPAMQGSSNGLMFSPEQNQAMRLMGLVPQQVDQSLYGVPISSTRGTQNQYSRIPVDKPQMQQLSTCSNSFPGGQYAIFPDQVSMQDGTSRQGTHEQNMVGHASGRGLVSGMNLENLQQANALQRDTSMQEFHGRQELAGSSQTLQEKTVMQGAPSQNVVALDPTEEKILFGTDDNIWDASGGSINMSALMQSAVAESSSNDMGVQEEWSGLSFLNSEIPAGNRQPSTFNDSGKQQTILAGNSSQIASPFSSGSVPLSDEVNMNNNYRSTPEFKQSGQKFPYEHGERLHTNSSYRSTQQSSEEGSKWLNRGHLQKPLAESSQIYGNAAHYVDAEMNAKSISGSLTPQQSFSTYNTSGQPYNKPNGWNVIESSSPGGDAVLKVHENENSLQHSQSNDKKRAMFEEMGHVSGMLKAGSVPNSTFELEHVKSAIGSPQVNREDSSLNNVGVIPNSSITRANQETGQLLPNSHHVNYWKHVESSLKCKGSEASGKSQHHLNKGHQVLESANSFDKETAKMHEMENCDKRENSSDSYRSNLSHHTSTGGLRENVCSDASDSRTLPGGKQRSSGQAGRKTSGPRKFQYHPMGNLEEDTEPSYGTKHATHSQAVSQQISGGSKNHDQGYFGQSRFFGHDPKNTTEMEGHLRGLQVNTKGLDEVPSRGIHPGYVPNISGPFDRSLGISMPDKAAQSSQNMLELLHKVDQSRERSTVMHFSSSERNPSSEMPEADNSDGFGSHLQRNQSSASQGFGLQLAPPSQWLPVSSRALSSQSSAQTVNSHSSSHTTRDIRDKGHMWLASSTQVQSLPPSHATSQEKIKNSEIDIPGLTGNESSEYNKETSSSALTSGFPYSRSQLQNPQMTGTSGQVTTNHSMNTSFNRLASHSKQTEDSSGRDLAGQSAQVSLPDTAGSISYNNHASSVDTSQPTSTNHSHERVLAPQISVGVAGPVSQRFNTSGISHQGAFSEMMPNVWTSVPAQQRAIGTQSQKVALNFFQSQQSDNNVESTSSAPQNLEVKDSHKGGSGPSEVGASFMNSQAFVCAEEQLAKESSGQQVSSGKINLFEKMTTSQGKESIVKHLSDASPSNPALTQRDIEAFGRSLKPYNFLHQNYSLLHQMRAMKSTEIDPNNRDLKRLKGTDTGLEGQQVAPKTGRSNDHNTMDGAALGHHTAAPSGDSKMLNFSGPVNNWERNASSQRGNEPSQDMLAFGRNDPQNYSQSNNTAPVRVEHSHISPQMAPSWFNQFGTFKNGQMLPIYDAQKTAPIKSLEQPFMLGKSSDSVHAHNSTEQVNTAADTSRDGNTWRSSNPATVAIEHFSSPQSLPLDVTDQRLVAVRPKKRKSAISELSPWHKEVTQGSQSLVTISMAEVDWANAANRLIDKIEDETEMIEDGPPMLRPKRRIILTTQLMQQLLRPPPAAVLSSDASSNYESVAYLVARLALGDACSLISCLGSNSHGPLDSTNLMSDKCKTSERIGDCHLSKVMEDFIGRARKLENDFLRLDKRASVLDLRVECQELEKFSVINRFAKFHGRGQVEGAETSSSSDAATNAQKPSPQRYVIALPMPRNLPDRICDLVKL
ncbi:hypothetical protein F0562_023689 [Nyssa sinensis]|uniref:Uncharacterized protein n=1 Tax=Nyssa sinensis TaxID=561372 RepID=A0A5J5BL50_9ASTE|nr:hypothetical protein F0562_023689 [Nyssa sinensis]